ncbi:MAG TPA: hypothetical protein PJ991_01640 [Kiritimatiellia bacterium]|nr:hypothetical protein [Kiritimatiellia bacterium]
MILRRFMAVLLLIATSASAQPPEDSAHNLFRQGIKKYAAGNYQEGLDLFLLALQRNPSPPDIEPAKIHYNIGIGHYRLSQPEQAGKSFLNATKTPDLSLQSDAYFNLGNSLYQQAQNLLNEGDVAPAFRMFQSASTNFMESLRLRSDDRNAKINFELSIQAQMKILQMVAMAMSRFQRGQQLVEEFQFVEAAEWFYQNLPLVEKALSIEPEIKKQFETMAERSAAVADIIAPVESGGFP